MNTCESTYVLYLFTSQRSCAHTVRPNSVLQTYTFHRVLQTDVRCSALHSVARRTKRPIIRTYLRHVRSNVIYIYITVRFKPDSKSRASCDCASRVVLGVRRYQGTRKKKKKNDHYYCYCQTGIFLVLCDKTRNEKVIIMIEHTFCAICRTHHQYK